MFSFEGCAANKRLSLLGRYAIGGNADEWAAAEAKVAAGGGAGKLAFSIANPDSTKGRKRSAEEDAAAAGKAKKDKSSKKLKHGKGPKR